MFILVIALAELVYLVEKRKIKLDLNEVFYKIENSKNFVVVPFDFEILKEMCKIKLKEMHNRVIVATSKILNVKLITKDEEIRKSKIVETIW